MTEQTIFYAAREKVTRMILIRHGQTHHNKSGRLGSLAEGALTAEGREQADRVGRRLKQDFEVSALYASPYERTQETASLIAEHLELPIIPNEDIIEYKFGDISNKSLADVKAESPELYQQLVRYVEMGPEAPFKRPDFPGEETMEVFQVRLKRFIDMITEKHPAQDVAVVSHAGVIKTMMAIVAGSDLNKRIPFFPQNGSLSIVDFYNKAPVIRLFNDVNHLGVPITYGKLLFI